MSSGSDVSTTRPQRLRFRSGPLLYNCFMTTTQWAAIERQARLFVLPEMTGPAADAAVRAIVAWEWANPDASPEMRSSAWQRLAQRAA